MDSRLIALMNYNFPTTHWILSGNSLFSTLPLLSGSVNIHGKEGKRRTCFKKLVDNKDDGLAN